MEEAECSSYVILVGSWAEFVYRESGLLPGFDPNIRTLDVDLLVRNLRRPSPPVNLIGLARERGFLVESDVMHGTTKLLDASGLEVEFLIGKMGAGVETSLKTNMGVTAQTLRHTEVLIENSIEVVCLGRTVRVPEPEAYVAHKMAINRQRGGKAEKDAQAALGLWPYLDYGKFKILVAGMTKKERSQISEFMQAHCLV